MNKLSTIAILSENKALASILRMVLANRRSLRVRIFASEAELINYMNIMPIDLLIYDCSLLDHEVATSVSYLQNCKTHNKQLQIIVLCKNIIAKISQAIEYANISEVIIKPMSPLYIEERVDAYLGAQNKTISNNKITSRLEENSVAYKDNVIALFGKKPNSINNNHIE